MGREIADSKQKTRYDGLSIAFHWITVLLIITMFGVGWYMTWLPAEVGYRSFLFGFHKSLGISVAALVLLRLGWRLIHPAPPLPASLSAWQRVAAKAGHRLLYGLLLLQPLSGYLSSSFSGYSTRVWGVPLPQWGWRDAFINECFTQLHVVSSIVLACLIGVHVCGALSHLVGVHENVLARMLPGKRRRAVAASTRRP